MTRLRVFKKGEIVEELMLFRDGTLSTVIGRKGDIVVDHKSISRQHARFDIAPDTSTITLIDCGGTHGTTLNGSKLEPDVPYGIKEGDIIVLGKSSRSYEVVMEKMIYLESEKEKGSMAQKEAKEVVQETTREERERQIAKMTASMRGAPPIPRSVPLSTENMNRDGNESESSEEFGPMPAPSRAAAVKAEEMRDELTRKYNIPVSNDANLSKREKAATCLSGEPSGSRLVVGSQDGSLSIFDFGGMDSNLEAFRCLSPEAGVGINHIVHSPSGDRIMVALSNAQPLLYDREGRLLAKFIRGDMYLRDLSHTKGHTMEVKCSCWHPTEKDLVMTGSSDGTVRLWNLASDLYLQMLRNQTVFKVKAKSGGALGRVGVSLVATPVMVI